MAVRSTSSIALGHPILVIEHDPALRTSITSILREDGYFVFAAGDETAALDVARDNPFSLILLDVPAALSHGVELCRRFRTLSTTAQVPLVLLLSRESEIAQAARLEPSITDYMLKPLVWEELRACVQALVRNGRQGRQRVRRSARERREEILEAYSQEEEVLTIGNLSIDVNRRMVFRNHRPIEIKRRLLFDLLVYFVRHRGIALTLDQLLTHVWGYDQEQVQACPGHTVAVHVHWLRELVEDDPNHPQFIKTVRGIGYRFKD